ARRKTGTALGHEFKMKMADLCRLLFNGSEDNQK
ncbi:hypothetical protein A2U01_0055106, partial [Trifolium medium]|nr:hypothetical protein [Trifolium medium]